MELSEVAEACQVSLATVKRRLARARSRFARLAGRDPYLKTYLSGEGED
jgi:RNA polymerase sigma-70 factor (ECF subfamily)